MKKMIIKSPARARRQANTRSSFYNTQLAITYGEIDSNNDNGTTNVLMVNGFLATNIKIPSSCYPSKDPTIGGIVYPPIGSQVMIEHPVGDVNSGWIRPAPLDERDDQIVSDLLSGGDKSLLPGGWEKTFDQETGKATFTNGIFTLEIDPDTDSVSYTDFEGNTINSNGATLEINGTIPVARKDDPTKSTIIEDSAFWGWAGRYNTFNIAWIAALATLQASGGSPAGVVAYATAMQGLLTTLGAIPVELTGKITAGSDKVKVG